MTNLSEATNIYFGAANGFEGFRSNFKEIFNHKEYNKLYVLKGGPGTGKSTLMKKIAKRFSDNDKCKTTVILCSSDPRSLDGLILECDDKRIGIVDGTAPHVVEAQFPGAIEEIINLADGFDYNALASRKEEILALGESKSYEYCKAYECLRIAGDVFEYVTDTFCNKEFYFEAEDCISKYIQNEISDNGYQKTSIFLLSSFGKNGYTFIEDVSIKKRKIHIGGDEISRYASMRMLAEKLSEMNIRAKIFTSPLSTKNIDIIETSNTVYTVTSSETNYFGNLSEEYRELLNMYRYTLKLAQDHFDLAAAYHFKLEDIYSANTSFKNNDLQIEKMCKVIEKMLL